MDIHRLIYESEGYFLEFQKCLPVSSELARSVCAFSNSTGGNIIVGIDPESREITGVDPFRIYEMEESVNKDVRDLVEPIPVVYTRVLVCKDKKLFVISVLPGNLKPYCLKGMDKFEGCYVRIDKHNQIATVPMLAELDRTSMNIHYDETPAYDADVEDINNDMIQEYLEKRKIHSGLPAVLINYAFLEKNKIITREGGKIYPTVFGILCFSEKANEYFPRAKVKCKIYEYEDKSKLNDIEVFSGPVIRQVPKVMSFFKMIDIPEKVLEILLINALVHRDYSYSQDVVTVSMFKDRLEVSSPGFLPAGITLNDIDKGVCVYRNNSIYRIFNEIGYSFKNGTGIQNANKLLQENSFGKILFSSAHNYFIATVSFDIVDDFLTKEEFKVLEYIDKNKSITNSQCQKLLKIKGKQAQYVLMKLVNKKKLISTGEKKGRKYVLAGKQE